MVFESVSDIFLEVQATYPPNTRANHSGPTPAPNAMFPALAAMWIFKFLEWGERLVQSRVNCITCGSLEPVLSQMRMLSSRGGVGLEALENTEAKETKQAKEVKAKQERRMPKQE